MRDEYSSTHWYISLACISILTCADSTVDHVSPAVCLSASARRPERVRLIDSLVDSVVVDLRTGRRAATAVSDAQSDSLPHHHFINNQRSTSLSGRETTQFAVAVTNQNTLTGRLHRVAMVVNALTVGFYATCCGLIGRSHGKLGSFTTTQFGRSEVGLGEVRFVTYAHYLIANSHRPSDTTQLDRPVGRCKLSISLSHIQRADCAAVNVVSVASRVDGRLYDV